MYYHEDHLKNKSRIKQHQVQDDPSKLHVDGDSFLHLRLDLLQTFTNATKKTACSIQKKACVKENEKDEKLEDIT